MLDWVGLGISSYPYQASAITRSSETAMFDPVGMRLQRTG